MPSGAPFSITNFSGASLHLTADSYEFAGDKGSYSLVGNLGPIAAMDILGREGPNAGHRIPAIYALEGDQLTICYQLGKGERPTEFLSPKGKLVLLIVYKRAPA